MFWWRVVLSCHCWFYPKECNSGGGSWHKSSVFVYQLDFFWVVSIYLSVVTMDRKERSSKTGVKRKRTGRQHKICCSNNILQETSLLWSPRSRLQSNSPVKPSCPNSHKCTLPAEKEEWQTAPNGRSFPIAHCIDTTDLTNRSNFYTNDSKEDQTR